jgi:hypothetical protein
MQQQAKWKPSGDKDQNKLDAKTLNSPAAKPRQT